MKLAKIKLIILVAVMFTFIAACGSPTTQSNTALTNNMASNSANSNVTKTNKNQPTYSNPDSSPSATIKAWREAIRKKDAEAFLETYAPDDVKVMREKAKADNLSIGDWLKKGYFNNPNIANMFPPNLEVSNEQINGDTATLNVKNKKKRVKFAFVSYAGGMEYQNARFFFVKENGNWKLSPKSAPPFTQQEQDAMDQELLDDCDDCD